MNSEFNERTVLPEVRRIGYVNAMVFYIILLVFVILLTKILCNYEKVKFIRDAKGSPRLFRRGRMSQTR